MGLVRAVITTAVAALAVAVSAPPAVAAHPCGVAEPTVKLRGEARRGHVARFAYFGPSPLRIAWGDGTRSGPVVVRRRTVSHRFRLSGRVTVSFVTSGGECCDVSHQSCSPLPNRVTKVRVTVRRPRSG